MSINRIDIREFREAGYLQEVNRQFLHPLGLALEVVVDDDGTERLGGVWDYRDDPEGIYYAGDMPDAEKAERIRDEQDKHHATRLDALGYIMQPLGSTSGSNLSESTGRVGERTDATEPSGT
jgi:hypothetical protein